MSKRNLKDSDGDELLVIEDSPDALSKATKRSSSRKARREPSNLLLTLLSSLTVDSDIFRSGVSLPVALHEPMTILQRIVEMLAHSELLTKVTQKADDSIARLVYTTAYCVSGFVGSERLFSDFNPILGETFEYLDPKTGAKIVAEQVCHHPPISALYASTELWQVHSNAQVEARFLGNSLDLRPQGRTYIEYPTLGDVFFYSSPQIRIHNLLFGSMWLEHYGELNVKNLTTGERACVTFKKSGFFTGTRYEIEGHVFNERGEKVVALEGKWNQYLTARWLCKTPLFPKGHVEKAWSVPADNFEGERYNFTRYAAKLLDFDRVHRAELLPPTDSRLRLDRLSLLRDNIERASQYKRALEERQRVERKERERLGESWTPVFFAKTKHDKFDDDMYLYQGGYWEERAAREKHLSNGGPDTIELFPKRITTGTAADFVQFQKDMQASGYD